MNICHDDNHEDDEYHDNYHKDNDHDDDSHEVSTGIIIVVMKIRSKT